MDEEIKTKYKDEIKRERDRQPSFGENKRLQEIDKELRALHEKHPGKPGFATDILELLRDIISGIVTSVAPTTADIEARATAADAATDYDQIIAWEKTNLGAPAKPPSPSGGGKRRKTKKRRSKKRRSKKRRTKKRRSKKRRSKKRRTSTRKTRRR
jgi:hypothetical protein